MATSWTNLYNKKKKAGSLFGRKSTNSLSGQAFPAGKNTGSGLFSRNNQMKIIKGLPGVSIDKKSGTYSSIDNIGGGPSMISPGGGTTMDITSPGATVTRPLPKSPISGIGNFGSTPKSGGVLDKFK